MYSMVLKTGIEKLDEILKGGVPEKSSILLLGPPKSGKTTFGIQFLFEGLKNNEYGVCILTNNFPEDFVKQFERFGNLTPILQNGLLRFVDCYSVHVGISKSNTVFIIRVNGPTALSEISIAMSEILRVLPANSIKRIVIDSISTLLLYNSPSLVLELVQILNGKAKNSNANTVFLVEEGTHSETDIMTLSSIADGVFHMKEINNQNLFEIKGFGLQNVQLNYKFEEGKLKSS